MAEARAEASANSPLLLHGVDVVVNGDGYPDIVIADGSIYFNSGQGAFPTNEPTPAFGPAAAVGDVNGDGIPDLAESLGNVSFGLGGGQFAPAVSYTIANSEDGGVTVAMASLSKKDKPG